MTMAQTIDMQAQNLSVTERGGSAGKYQNLPRQLRRRLVEIDEQIKALEERKKDLLLRGVK